MLLFYFFSLISYVDKKLMKKDTVFWSFVFSHQQIAMCEHGGGIDQKDRDLYLPDGLSCYQWLCDSMSFAPSSDLSIVLSSLTILPQAKKIDLMVLEILDLPSVFVFFFGFVPTR